MPSDRARRRKRRQSSRRSHSSIVSTFWPPSLFLVITICTTCVGVVMLLNLSGFSTSIFRKRQLVSFPSSSSMEKEAYDRPHFTTVKDEDKNTNETKKTLSGFFKLPHIGKIVSSLSPKNPENVGSTKSHLSSNNQKHLSRRERWKLAWKRRHKQIASRYDAQLKPPVGVSVLVPSSQENFPKKEGSSRYGIMRDHVGRIVEPANLFGDEDLGTDVDNGGKVTYFHKSSWHTVTAPSLYNSKKQNPQRNGPSTSFRDILSTQETNQVRTPAHPSTFTVVKDKSGEQNSQSDFNVASALYANKLRSNNIKEIEISPIKLMKKRGMIGKNLKRAQNEFSGCREGLPPDGMVQGHNVTKVSHSLYKIMKLFGFSSVVDSPAGSHAIWIREFIQRMVFEQPHFIYVGIDYSSASLERARANINDIIDNSEFYVSDVEKTIFPERKENRMKGLTSPDVMFHWTNLDGNHRTDPRYGLKNEDYTQHVKKVIAAAKKSNIGYLIIGQYPSLDGPAPTYRNGKWSYVDRGIKDVDPFMMNNHVRGAIPVPGGTPQVLYLTFYSLRAIPSAELQI